MRLAIFVAIFLLCVFSLMGFLIYSSEQHKASVRGSCEQEGRGSIGGDRSPILCYDRATGQVFVPKARRR